jgi:glycerol uptake facilitator-like aquaporin
MRVSLPRRAAAETIGAALLVLAVVGSGISAARLSQHDVGLQLFENAAATGVALVAIILALGPVSGAHLNPIVTAVDVALGGLTLATFGLILVVFGLVRSGRGPAVAFPVGAYIAGAYFFTSSTSSRTPPSRSPGRSPTHSRGSHRLRFRAFLLMELVGGGFGVVAVRLLYLSSPPGDVAAQGEEVPSRGIRSG